jgi:hypothetical protein
MRIRTGRQHLLSNSFLLSVMKALASITGLASLALSEGGHVEEIAEQIKTPKGMKN